jgi:hypothetical protein
MLQLFELLIWLDDRLPNWRIGVTLVAGILVSALAFKLIPDRNAGGIACIVTGIASVVIGFRWQKSAMR